MKKSLDHKIDKINLNCLRGLLLLWVFARLPGSITDIDIYTNVLFRMDNISILKTSNPPISANLLAQKILLFFVLFILTIYCSLTTVPLLTHSLHIALSNTIIIQTIWLWCHCWCISLFTRSKGLCVPPVQCLNNYRLHVITHSEHISSY